GIYHVCTLQTPGICAIKQSARGNHLTRVNTFSESGYLPPSSGAVILKFAGDRVIAHQALFAHRHSDATPQFHDELTELWHSSAPKVLTLAFRGGGKSTLAEEALVLAAAMKLVRNVLIIGSNSDRANDRLRAIKHELETNELLVELYGDLRGPVWNEGRIVLAHHPCIHPFRPRPSP